MRNNHLNNCIFIMINNSLELMKRIDCILTFKRNNITFKAILICLFLLTLSNLNAQTLGALATKLNINFGTPAIESRFKKGTKWFRDTLVAEFNMTNTENALKMNSCEPRQGVFDFTLADTIMNFAKANNMKSKGHVLVYHIPTPGWLYARTNPNSTNKFSRAELMAIVKRHIDSVVGHYKGRILEWDVVNETIMDSFTVGESPLKHTFYQQIIGNDYIDSAFVWAHRADPSAYLYLNDYSGEYFGSWEKAKSDSIYTFVKGLIARGIPIHGVGMECHIGNYADANLFNANIKRLGALGLRVSLTETDIMNSSNDPKTWTTLANGVASNWNATSFITWGIDDSASWMGSDCGCLIWDSMHQAKPVVYNAIKSVFLKASKTVAAQRANFIAIPADNRVPTIPGNLTATAVYKKVTLKWVASLRYMTYTIKRSTTKGSGYLTIITGLTGTSYTDTTGLKSGVNYYYIIVAVNPFYTSSNSNEAFALIPFPLPVQLLKYNVSKIGTSKVKIDWKVVNDEKVEHFEVQSSTDGVNFKSFQSVFVSDSLKNDYYVVDDNPIDGNNFYRLVVYEDDGNVKYLDTKLVKFSISIADKISIYPNPASSNFNLVLPEIITKSVLVSIKSTTGNTISTNTLSIIPGQTIYQISLKKLSVGIYIVEVVGNEFSKSIKLIIR